MPLACPRCVLTNSDSTPTRACGYDLTPQIFSRMLKKSASSHRPCRVKRETGEKGATWTVCIPISFHTSRSLAHLVRLSCMGVVPYTTISGKPPHLLRYSHATLSHTTLRIT